MPEDWREMRRSHGFRSRTRQKLKGGRFSIAEALQTFEENDKVRIIINPSIHSGMPHPRVQGRSGIVSGIRGRSYIVDVKDGGLTKQYICRPEHLKPEKVQKKAATKKEEKDTEKVKPKSKPKAVKKAPSVKKEENKK